MEREKIENNWAKSKLKSKFKISQFPPKNMFCLFIYSRTIYSQLCRLIVVIIMICWWWKSSWDLELTCPCHLKVRSWPLPTSFLPYIKWLYEDEDADYDYDVLLIMGQFQFMVMVIMMTLIIIMTFLWFICELYFDKYFVEWLQKS